MQDEDKTNEQLILELHELRERATESEKDRAERKRTEQELRESEERFKLAMVFGTSVAPALLSDPQRPLKQ